jgi:thioredoxin-related protein
MKNHLTMLMILFFSFMLQSRAGETKEKLFINDAAREAAKEHKMLVIEFWSLSCNPCMGLKRDIFGNTVQADFVHKYFHVVPLSEADSLYNPLVKYFHLQYQSTIIYLDRSGNEIDRTVGYNGDRDAYESVMNDIAGGKNRYNDIVKKYRRDTSNVMNCCLMARKLASRYELNEAARLYNKILASDPSDKLGLRAECLFKIAEIELIQTGDLKKMREFVDVDSKNTFAPKAYVYLINDLIAKKDKAGCLAICEAGFGKYPDSWEILNKYAWALCSFKIQEEYPKALTMVQKSITLNPSRPGTYSTEAWIYFEMGDKDKAVQLQKKAIEIFPDRSFVQDLETFRKD